MHHIMKTLTIARPQIAKSTPFHKLARFSITSVTLYYRSIGEISMITKTTGGWLIQITSFEKKDDGGVDGYV